MNLLMVGTSCGTKNLRQIEVDGGQPFDSVVRFSRSVQRCGQTELRPAQKVTMSLAGSVAGGGARSVEGAVAAMLDTL